MAASHERQPNFDAVVTVNGKPIRTVHFSTASLEDPDTVIDVPGAQIGSQPAAIHLQKTGPGRLYYALDLHEAMPVGKPTVPLTLLQRWYDRAWHPERLEDRYNPSGYVIKRIYLRNTSRRNAFWEDTVPAPGVDFQQSDDIIVRLVIDANRPGSHLVVEEPIPSGCTISEVSGDEEEEWDNWWSYTDVRDDKIVFFIGDLTRGRHEIDYHLRAAAPGIYDAMPTSLTGTFDPTLHDLGRPAHIAIEGGQE
jgi:hypothetical protein